jgi:hypothetical protein
MWETMRTSVTDRKTNARRDFSDGIAIRGDQHNSPSSNGGLGDMTSDQAIVVFVIDAESSLITMYKLSRRRPCSLLRIR